MTGVLKKPAFERLAHGGEAPPAHANVGIRQTCFAEGFLDTPAFDRKALLPGNRIAGPALVEEHASTTVLMPGDTLKVDALGNLVIAVGGAR